VITTLSVTELTQIGECLQYARHDARAKAFQAQSDPDDCLSVQIIDQQKKRIRNIEKLENAVARELHERRTAVREA